MLPAIRSRIPRDDPKRRLDDSTRLESSGRAKYDKDCRVGAAAFSF
jgi:hypothetical protein